MSDLVYCIHCGKKIADISVYCRYCGRSQENETDNITISQLSTSSSEMSSVAKIEISQHTEKGSQEKHETRKKTVFAVLLTVFLIGLSVTLLLVFSDKQEMDSPNPQELSTETPYDATPESVNREALSGNEIATLSESVLILYVYDENRNLLSSGSGFVAFDDSTLITNYHVIDQGYYVEAISESDVIYNISGVNYYDVVADIAILRFEIPTGLPVLPIADSTQVRVGDEIYAIGSPLGLKNTVSNGIVSAFRKTDDFQNIQITASISSGSSGGVLLNTYGEVIGITFASYSEGQNLNLAPYRFRNCHMKSASLHRSHFQALLCSTDRLATQSQIIQR